MAKSDDKSDRGMIQWEGNGFIEFLRNSQNVDASIREHLLNLFGLLKDRMRDVHEQHRDALQECENRHSEKIRDLEEELRKERSERERFQRDEEERRRSLAKYQEDSDLTLQAMEEIQKKRHRVAVGCSCLAILMSGAVGAERLVREPDVKAAEASVLVEQLKARVESYDAVMQSREKQLDRYMYGDNDKYGALLKAVDALKDQVKLYDWYLKDDTRDLLEGLKDFANNDTRELLRELREFAEKQNAEK